MGGWLLVGLSLGGLGVGSLGGGDPARFEPNIIDGCSNLDGSVAHDGVSWSANSSLVQLDELPDRWLTDDSITGEIVIDGETARFFTFDGPVLELRRYGELHCSIG